jgi:hypothetical protein
MPYVFPFIDEPEFQELPLALVTYLSLQPTALKPFA